MVTMYLYASYLYPSCGKKINENVLTFIRAIHDPGVVTFMQY